MTALAAASLLSARRASRRPPGGLGPRPCSSADVRAKTHPSARPWGPPGAHRDGAPRPPRARTGRTRTRAGIRELLGRPADRRCGHGPAFGLRLPGAAQRLVEALSPGGGSLGCGHPVRGEFVQGSADRDVPQAARDAVVLLESLEDPQLWSDPGDDPASGREPEFVESLQVLGSHIARCSVRSATFIGMTRYSSASRCVRQWIVFSGISWRASGGA